MKLKDLVIYLFNNRVEDLINEYNLNNNSEVILVYMDESLKIDSDIYFYPIEETDDDIIFYRNNKSYIQLFPLDYISDLIKSNFDKNSDINEIVKRILEYRIKDA